MHTNQHGWMQALAAGSLFLAIGGLLYACDVPHEAAPCVAQNAAHGATLNKDWRDAEKRTLTHHVQMTFSDRFVKAGESYFSPDNKKVIFQAVEKPAEDKSPDEFYGMYVADVKYDSQQLITGFENIKRLSPQGSANTCGWFHPTQPNVVIFSSTIGPPTQSQPPGYQRSSQRYAWSFPPEMRVVRCDLTQADGTAKTLSDVGGYAGSYQAEGSISFDGRHLLYCSLESGDGDLFVLDLQTGAKNRIVQAKGYDGGPFFSPDAKRICYRSDRAGNNLLQLFVAELAFNQKGEIVGIEREYQLTDDACVNWCPFWTTDGRGLVYSTSQLGESNYEIFMIDADPGNVKGSNGTTRYGTARQRITYFEDGGNVAASDVLPAFSTDGKWMIWASRRGTERDVQLWVAKFEVNQAATKPTPEMPKPSPSAAQASPPPAQKGSRAGENRIQVDDPDTGRVFFYDLVTHDVFEYDMGVHKLVLVTDQKLIKHIADLYESQREPD